MTWRLPNKDACAQPPRQKRWGLLPPAGHGRYTPRSNSDSEGFQKAEHFKGAAQKKGVLRSCGLARGLNCVSAVASRGWDRPRGGSFSANSGNSTFLHEANFPH